MDEALESSLQSRDVKKSRKVAYQKKTTGKKRQRDGEYTKIMKGKQHKYTT